MHERNFNMRQNREDFKKVEAKRWTQPVRTRKKRSSSANGKGKSRRFKRGKSNGKGRGSSNYPIVEVYNDGSKTQTSHMKVPPGYAVLDCVAAKSLCGAKPVRSGGTDMCTRE